jgi:hypothetical protein
VRLQLARQALLRIALLVSGGGLLHGCGGELPFPPETEEIVPIEPQGPQCHLPKENPVVVDISGEVMSAICMRLFSDGTVWFWGGGYPTLRYCHLGRDMSRCA